MLVKSLGERKMKTARALLLANASALALSACGGRSAPASIDPLPPADPIPSVDPNAPNYVPGTVNADSLLGSVDDDLIEGFGGNDFVLALGGNDEIYGGDGEDTIRADAGNDIIFGGPGNDTIYPGDGDDKAYGGDGDDIIYLSSGNDLEDGGLGNDTLKIDSEHSGIATTIDLHIGQYYFTAQGSSTFLNLYSIENVESNADADLTILDTLSLNTITTGAGDDVIKSKGGNDIISTGGGNDRVELATGFIYDVNLGPGNDEVVLGLTYSTIDGGTGTDGLTVNSLSGVSEFYADLGAGFYFFKGVATSQDGFDALLTSFENVTITSAMNAELIGSDGANVITTSGGTDQINGMGGNDILNGGAGADTITGGAGTDTLTGGADADTFVFGASATDVVTYAGADTDTANVEAITDFVVADDTIQIADTVTFANLTMAAGTTSATVTYGSSDLAAGIATLTALTAAMEADTAGTASTAAASGLQVYVFKTTAGTGLLDGKTFLVINDDTAAIAATDVIIDITGVTGTLTSADFVIA